MTFLNATLMLGIAAAALPVILHLMGRKEPKKVVFPAVRFLSRRIETQRSRLRIRRWWLLALRVLALCALAIGLAGPIIDRSVSVAWLSIAILCSVAIGLLVMAGLAVTRAMSRSTIGGLLATASLVFVGAFAWAGYTLAVSPTALANASAPVAVVFVIDNAPTAAWQNTEGVSRLDRMKQAANAIISGLAETSRIGIVDRSGTPAAFSLDRSGAISRLSGLGIRQAPVPLAPRLEAAIRLASVSELSVRRVIVLTDLARASWSGDLASESLLTTRKLDSRNDSGSIPITVFDIGPPQSTNRRLHAVQYFDSTPPKGTPVPISVSISHTGAPPTEPEEVTAELRVYKSDPSKPVIRNGEIVRPEAMAKDRTSAKVSPDGESEVTLTIPSLSLGSHHAEIRLIGKDAFPLDDATYMTLQVLPPSHGLIVTDRPEDGYYLQLAIAVPFAIDDPDAEYQMQLVSSEDFSAAELGEFDVVVLLDPPSGLVADPRLDRFVREGGTAVVFLGPSIEADSIQLPLMPTLRRRWRVADPGTFY
ncbi:MAG: BatA domain-containing protein, partial [Planctomycetota bacterium]